MNVSLRTFTISASLFALNAILPPSAEAEEPMVVPHEYIIQRKQGAGQQQQRTFERSYLTREVSPHFEVVTPNRSGVGARSASSLREPMDRKKVQEDCAEILKDPTVETCEPNVIKKFDAIPNDSFRIFQWHLIDYDNAADMKADIAWSQGTGNKETLVGVIDSGIYATHPDLKDNLWSNPNEASDGVDNDGNGYIDDLFGVDVDGRTNDASDCVGHGTHVAGIIGATGNNERGVTGINWSTSLIVARISQGCGGEITMANTIRGYDYFYDLKRRGHNIRVVNASFGGSSFSQAEYDAVARLNSVDILLVASAGNDNRRLSSNPNYPASFDLPNVIAVGATGPTLRITLYTNWGSDVDIAAPGGDTRYSYGGILSTWSPLQDSSLTYKWTQGTSMAAPMVTGALTLLASQRPYLNGTHLKNILLQSADELLWLALWVNGGRFLNLGAMSLAADPTDECPSDPLKLAPGLCGCGSADTYGDSDSDNTFDCVDGCPRDPDKTARGACGCGVSDRDRNGDGVADCNANEISGVTPRAPTLTAGKGSLTIKITPKTGTVAYLKVVVKPLKGKTKTSFYKQKTATGRIDKLPGGATVTVQYAYMVEGQTRILSSYSAAKKVKIK